MAKGYSQEEIDFVKEFNHILNNREMGEILGVAPSTASWLRCQLGLRKMELEYWTPIQVKWLKRLYKHVGDYEIALMFEEAYPKNKTWTLKHIEKKRMYLGLKRTRAEIKAIRERNKVFGCWMVGSKNAWETRGKAEIGNIRVWNDREYIKTESGFELLNRYLWQKHKGEIPEGMNVVAIDPLKGLNNINNLQLLSDAELGARNSMNRYPSEVKEIVILLKRLNKTIYEKQNN
jgi:hypothetical protein